MKFAAWVLLPVALLPVPFAPDAVAAESAVLKIDQSPESVRIFAAEGREMVRYQLTRPTQGSAAAAESGCYFHPLATPAGIPVTVVAPADHKHHRGIFLGWVEMHGKKSGDFWGWGEHAPTMGRRIVHRALKEVRSAGEKASFIALNDWRAEEETLLREELHARVQTSHAGTILDLTYTLTPPGDITLARWAFSGFCARLRTDGKARLTSPSGAVTRPSPNHMKPDSDLPDELWYDLSTTLPDGKVVGLAVINHPQNPETLWHNIASITMLNPCIVAPQAIELKANRPLVLRYRVVAHDGEPNKGSLDTAAAEFRATAE